MNEKRAQDRTTAYINGLQEYKRLIEWNESVQPKKIMNVFERSCLSKKPDEVLKQLALVLRPQFQWPEVFTWTRKHKLISITGMASSIENRIFCLPDEIRHLYSERAAIITNFMLRQNDGVCTSTLMTRASISDYAITQLMKRKEISGIDSPREITFILQYCAVIAQRIHDSTFDTDTMTSIMLPYNHGALIAVFMTRTPMQIRPDMQMYPDMEGFRMLSVRNWLDKDKLSTVDMERMGEIEEVSNIMDRDNKDADERLLRWLDHNARPWQYSDHTPGHIPEDIDTSRKTRFNIFSDL